MARDRKRAKDRRRRPNGAQPPRAPRVGLDDAVEDKELEGTTPGSHPDSGLEDVVDTPGPEGHTPAPDPLKHGSPYVDEAKLAEAGATVPGNQGEGLDVRDEAALDGDGDGRLADADAGGDGRLDDGDDGFDDADPDGVDRAPDKADEYVPTQTGRRGRPAAVAASAAAAERAEARTAQRRDDRERGRFVTFLGHSADELRRVQWPNRSQTFQGTAVTLGFVVVAGGFLGLMDAIWRPIVEAIL